MKQNYSIAFIFALCAHVALFALVFYTFNLSSPTPLSSSSNGPQPVDIVQAVGVDQASVEKEVANIEQQQRAADKAQQQAQQKLAAERTALQQQQARAAKALAAVKIEQQAQQSELAKIKQQRILLAKQQAAQDLQQKLAAEQKLAAQQKLAAVQKLAAAQQQQAAAAAKAKQLASELDKYKQLILNAIYPNWLVSQKDGHLSTDLVISLANNGAVLNVSVDKSSGSAAFDRSAVAAVYKSSPLPVSNDPAIFALFKQFKLTLQPENVVAGALQ